MVERRDVLKAALGALAASVTSAKAGEGAAPAPAANPTFSRERDVVERARSLAKKAYAPPANELREPFSTLSFEQYVHDIRLRPGAAKWAGENKGFSIEPLHRGWIFTAPVELNVVEGGMATPIPFDQNMFDYGQLKIAEKLPDMGFSGFRVLRAQNGGDGDMIAQFQGASFFRARVSKDQPLGVTARGLSLRTADPRGEEFPIFRAFWIERPALGDNSLIIHALLDSPSVTGAYRFTLHPGEATIIDAEMTLFPRVDIDHIGIAGLAGASLFTPLDRRRSDDIRPAAAEASGLQILTGAKEWLWRPLSNRNNLQLSSFMDANPRGFGFLVRDRDIGAYQDDLAHWEQRPSLWIEPLGEWGEGGVQLVEIPSESDFNQNIVAYWRPKQVLTAGVEANFAYRQFWCWEPPARPPLAYVSDARGGRAGAPKLRRFLVVFTGDILADAARAANLKPVLTTSPGSAKVIGVYANPQAKTCRVLFDIDPGGETFCELRLVLNSGDDPISETWLYRWTL
ncbi:MAG: glucan biosynthesis protein [Methylocystis sp.]